MSLDVDVATNGTRPPVSREKLIDAARTVLRAERVRNALVSITLLDKPAMARMNTTHLGHRGPTDVISFGFTRATATDPVVGDIYICPAIGRANASARGEPIRRELTRLVVHGCLHILGYTHPEDGGREHSLMWSKQERLVARLAAGRRR